MRLARNRARRLAAVAIGAVAALGASGVAIGANASTTATTAGASSLIVSPRDGATINHNTVRIVVRAGNEYDDVNARLNGKQIGPDFTRPGGGLRVLVANDSEGLRYGDNELRVTATEGNASHTSAVRFRVVTPQLLVGAGQTLFVPVGTAAHIDGLIRLQSPGATPSETKWAVVSAPAGSRFARARSAHAAAAKNETGPPVDSVHDPLRSHGKADDPVATFTPDALGPYRVQLTAGVGSDVVSNDVTVEAIPDTPTLLIDTEASAADGRPGIKLGDVVWKAPPMARDAKSNDLYSGKTPNGIDYDALWQVLALDRTTLALISNETYGLCVRHGTLDYYFCRLEEGKSEPTPVNLAGELQKLGDSAMVIVSSHPAGSDSKGSAYWAPPSADSVPAVLDPIGGPHDSALLNGATAGGVSAIGVPGSPAGSATVNVVPGGSGAMQGYLGVDPNKHFAFMPAARVDFDSRASEACANGFCTITQTVGGQTAKATLRTDENGYLVSAFDSHTLKLASSQLFVMAGPGASDRLGVVDMTKFLTQVSAGGNVILVTMCRAANGGLPLAGQGLPQTPGEWAGLANEIAALGGTQNSFNLSAASSSSLYSLIGWGGAGLGNGVETTSDAGRLQGALTPNNLWQFRPTDVSASGAPAEQMIQIMLRKPVGNWPLDGTPAYAAFQWIGNKVGLSTNPRIAYWHSDIDLAKYDEIISQVRDLTNTGGFPDKDFATAKAELIKELGWAGSVRDYLAKLAQPQDQAGSVAWEEATKVNNQLTSQLKNLQEKAEVQFSWASVAASVGDIVAEGLGLKKSLKNLAKFAEVLASTTLLSGELFDKTWNGKPANDAERTVQADELATELEGEAKRQVDAYDRMGDMIVSDPTKLQEVGTWAGCEDADNGCDGGRYAQFALPAGATEAAYATAVRGIDRLVYERLVPLAFPIWDTGTAHDPNPSRFQCGVTDDSPFQPDTPPEAYASVLRGLDPDHPGDRSYLTDNEWQTYVTVARSGTTYSWPSKELLERMYGTVSTSDVPTEGGLGISPQDFLATAKHEYHPGGAVDCAWDNSRNP